MKEIKRLRIELGESQDLIADKIGVSTRGYRKIENGECFPIYKNAKALEQIFHKPIEDLLSESDNQTSIVISA